MSSITNIDLGVVDNDNLGDSIRIGFFETNKNDAFLQNKTTDESTSKTADFVTCAKINVRNEFSANILYDGYLTYSSASATPVFIGGSPNFHLTSETAITLNNPTGMVAGKTQRGMIVAEAEITVAGTYWKNSGGTNLGVPDGKTYDTYVYTYIQISETLLILSFLAGVDGGI